MMCELIDTDLLKYIKQRGVIWEEAKEDTHKNLNKRQ